MRRRASAPVTILTAALLAVVPPALWAAEQQLPHARQVAQVFQENEPLAQKGNASAQYNMGVLYDRGYGVQQDYAKARQWYKKAAAQHYGRAEHNLGIMYEAGKGVPRDMARAAYWFRRGAEDGQVASQNNLAVLFMKGEGLPQNTGKAAFWAAKAAAGGSNAAMDNLPRIVADLPHVHVDAGDVDVHDQPDDKSRVIADVASDTVMIVLARRDRWTQVLLPKSYSVGWVANDLLSGSQAPLAASVPSVSQSSGAVESAPGAARHASSKVTERSKPKASVTRSMPSRAAGRKLSSPGSLPSDNRSGAVGSVSPVLKQDEPEPHDRIATSVAGETGNTASQHRTTAKSVPARIGVGTANVRSQPNRGSKVIGQLHRGDRVRVLKHRNGWRYVQTPGGLNGWIAGYLLVRT